MRKKEGENSARHKSDMTAKKNRPWEWLTDLRKNRCRAEKKKKTSPLHRGGRNLKQPRQSKKQCLAREAKGAVTRFKKAESKKDARGGGSMLRMTAVRKASCVGQRRRGGGEKERVKGEKSQHGTMSMNYKNESPRVQEASLIEMLQTRSWDPRGDDNTGTN